MTQPEDHRRESKPAACGIYCPPLPPPPPRLCPPPSRRPPRPHPPGRPASCGAPCAPRRCGRRCRLGRDRAPGGRMMRTGGSPERKTGSHLQEENTVMVKVEDCHCQQPPRHLLLATCCTCVERTGRAGRRGAALAGASRLLTAMAVAV